MTLKELMTKLPDLREEERLPIRSLLSVLTPVSVSSLMAFQFSWNGARPYDDFVVAQNRVIKELVDWEQSDSGKAARQVFGLSPLTDETEISDMPVVTAVLRKTQTNDGLVEMEDDIQLGKEYRVDLNTIRTLTLKTIDKGDRHERKFIMEIDSGKWLPVELLFIPGYTT